MRTLTGIDTRETERLEFNICKDPQESTKVILSLKPVLLACL